MSGGKDRREVTVRLAEGEVRSLAEAAERYSQRIAARTPKRPMPGDVSPGPAAHIDGDRRWPVLDPSPTGECSTHRISEADPSCEGCFPPDHSDGRDAP